LQTKRAANQARHEQVRVEEPGTIKVKAAQQKYSARSHFINWSSTDLAGLQFGVSFGFDPSVNHFHNARKIVSGAFQVKVA